MKIRSGFIDSIGNTPLIKLRAASQASDIYGKAEFLNPGGSIKDRAALAMIEHAEKQGKLQPGGGIDGPQDRRALVDTTRTDAHRFTSSRPGL